MITSYVAKYSICDDYPRRRRIALIEFAASIDDAENQLLNAEWAAEWIDIKSYTIGRKPKHKI